MQPTCYAGGKPVPGGGRDDDVAAAGYPAGDQGYQGYQQQPPGGGFAPAAYPPRAGGGPGGGYGSNGVVQGVPIWGRVQSYVSGGEREDSPGLACCAWTFFVLGIFMPWWVGGLQVGGGRWGGCTSAPDLAGGGSRPSGSRCTSRQPACTACLPPPACCLHAAGH
jgi:hypothetical protein